MLFWKLHYKHIHLDLNPYRFVWEFDNGVKQHFKETIRQNLLEKLTAMILTSKKTNTNEVNLLYKEPDLIFKGPGKSWDLAFSEYVLKGS